MTSRINRTPSSRLPAANPSALPFVETKAADWYAARLRGERLPAHQLPEDIEEHIEAMNYDRSCQPL